MPARPIELLEGRALLTCMMPTGMNPDMMAEYQAVANLVDPAHATVTAVRDGQWSNPATWSTGAIPGAGADVSIPEGITVTVDGVFNAPLHTIGLDGTMIFDPQKVTSLTVDTFVVTCCGNLQMGTADQPIGPAGRATIIFVGQAPIDTNWDPRELSRGLISEGTVSIYGADVTPYAALAKAPMAGDRTLILSQVPTNWQPGDQLVLTGTDPYHNQDEQLTIQSIAQNVVTLAQPLLYNHTAPAPDLSAYVANMSRNVTFESADPNDIWARGHVMFMHTDQETVVNAAFDGLGRTDKKRPLNNPVLDANGQLVPGTGTNPVGRYALHFHQDGIDPSQTPILVEGCVVNGSPGWGYDNHSSDVDFEDDVAYNVDGAGFVSEAGDEIGTYNRDLAIRSVGSGVDFGARAQNDLGHQGFGFWIQSPGVSVTNDIAVGQARAGFLVWGQGLDQGPLGITQFPAANLPDPSWANGKPFVNVSSVPIRAFSGNTIFASGEGVEWWSPLLVPVNPAARSEIVGLTAWNNKGDRNFQASGILLKYANHVDIVDARILGNPAAPNRSSVAINSNLNQSDIQIIDPYIDGFGVGVIVPGMGHDSIQGGYINAIHGVDVNPDFFPLHPDDRVLDIDDKVRFGTLSPAALAGAVQLDVSMNLPPIDFSQRDITQVLSPLMVVRYAGKTLYLPQQAPDFVPWPAGTGPADLPPQFVGLTNQQLWDRFGLAVMGAVAPAATTTSPRVNARLGDTWDYPSVAAITSRTYTNQLSGYRLTYLDANYKSVTDPAPIALQAGWNLIARTIDGQRRTFLVYGDATPPTFVIDPAQPLTVRAADILANKAFVIRGTIRDNSSDPIPTYFSFSNLGTLPVSKRPDGTSYITLTTRICDAAGNSTTLRFDVTIVN